jgi:hypothetical protein
MKNVIFITVFSLVAISIVLAGMIVVDSITPVWLPVWIMWVLTIASTLSVLLITISFFVFSIVRWFVQGYKWSEPFN